MQSLVLRAVVLVFAFIGLLAVIGATGMLFMHGTMMHTGLGDRMMAMCSGAATSRP